MRNLSNLGLVEMTEQEMREVNGGFAWWGWALVAGIAFLVSGDTRICTCDTKDYCISCGWNVFKSKPAD